MTDSRSRRRKLPARGTTPPATDAGRYGGSFTGTLFRYPGVGGWHFVEVPDELAPPVTHAWGRTPVQALVDDHAWKTSVWRGKDGRTLLAVPKRVRGAKGDGDTIEVRVAFDVL